MCVCVNRHHKFQSATFELFINCTTSYNILGMSFCFRFIEIGFSDIITYCMVFSFPLRQKKQSWRWCLVCGEASSTSWLHFRALSDGFHRGSVWFGPLIRGVVCAFFVCFQFCGWNRHNRKCSIVMAEYTDNAGQMSPCPLPELLRQPSTLCALVVFHGVCVLCRSCSLVALSASPPGRSCSAAALGLSHFT